VGILGQGSNGTAGNYAVSAPGGPGSGGSGGTHGAGGPGTDSPGASQNGFVGAVRIIYPGSTRSFPSTNTGDL
jgi:hypothetical protein